jgi:hypothetical protein
MLGLHVCEVPFAVAGVVDDFLTRDGKAPLPISVPFSFGLPLVIDAPGAMGPNATL